MTFYALDWCRNKGLNNDITRHFLVPPLFRVHSGSIFSRGSEWELADGSLVMMDRYSQIHLAWSWAISLIPKGALAERPLAGCLSGSSFPAHIPRALCTSISPCLTIPLPHSGDHLTPVIFTSVLFCFKIMPFRSTADARVWQVYIWWLELQISRPWSE